MILALDLQLDQADGSVPAQSGKSFLPGGHSSSNLRQLFLYGPFPSLPRTNRAVGTGTLDNRLLLTPASNTGIPAVTSAKGGGERGEGRGGGVCGPR